MTKKVNSNNSLILLTFIAIVFLALNSILCKAAFVNNSIDPYSFTFFRLLSAMIMLLLIYFYKHKKILFLKQTNWVTSFMLFLYALSFSYAYIDIDAGFGTLLLFGVVQIVMIISSIFHKEKINTIKALGIFISFCGLVYLVYPKESFEVSLVHVFLMIISGISWAIYSVLGKRSIDALGNTTDNFIKASLYITIFYFIFNIENINFNAQGLILAIISGSITSALGYIVWYQILPKIKILTASLLQLFVPVIAIVLSVIFLHEPLTFNLVISAGVIMFGILLAISL
jgi:drug/metabolite transporter (DMT)-like permease